MQAKPDQQPAGEEKSRKPPSCTNTVIVFTDQHLTVIVFTDQHLTVIVFTDQHLTVIVFTDQQPSLHPHSFLRQLKLKTVECKRNKKQTINTGIKVSIKYRVAQSAAATNMLRSTDGEGGSAEFDSTLSLFGHKFW